MYHSKGKQVILVISNNPQQRFKLLCFHFLWWDCLGALTESGNGGRYTSLQTFSYLFLTHTQLYMVTRSHSAHVTHGVRKRPVTVLRMETLSSTRLGRSASSPEYTLDRSMCISALCITYMLFSWEGSRKRSYCLSFQQQLADRRTMQERHLC